MITAHLNDRLLVYVFFFMLICSFVENLAQRSTLPIAPWHWLAWFECEGGFVLLVIVTEKMSESINTIANEPSVAFYRIQEHVRKTLPQLVERKVSTLCILWLWLFSLCVCIPRPAYRNDFAIFSIPKGNLMIPYWKWTIKICMKDQLNDEIKHESILPPSPPPPKKNKKKPT